jgi:hypothetical protein
VPQDVHHVRIHVESIDVSVEIDALAAHGISLRQYVPARPATGARKPHARSPTQPNREAKPLATGEKPDSERENMNCAPSKAFRDSETVNVGARNLFAAHETANVAR